MFKSKEGLDWLSFLGDAQTQQRVIEDILQKESMLDGRPELRRAAERLHQGLIEHQNYIRATIDDNFDPDLTAETEEERVAVAKALLKMRKAAPRRRLHETHRDVEGQGSQGVTKGCVYDLYTLQCVTCAAHNAGHEQLNRAR